MPKRNRDYAKERAQRDAKYQALGYESYNKFETERRNTKAKARGFKNYSRQRTLVNRITDYLSGEEIADTTGTSEVGTPQFWDWFRSIYNRVPAAA